METMPYINSKTLRTHNIALPKIPVQEVDPFFLNWNAF